MSCDGSGSMLADAMEMYEIMSDQMEGRIDQFHHKLMCQVYRIMQVVGEMEDECPELLRPMPGTTLDERLARLGPQRRSARTPSYPARPVSPAYSPASPPHDQATQDYQCSPAYSPASPPHETPKRKREEFENRDPFDE